MNCEKCGASINPNRPGWGQYVEGWEMNRKQGGTNQIHAPIRHQRFLCNQCMTRLKLFGDEQASLL